MNHSLFWSIMFLCFSACAQKNSDRQVGERCENCELLFAGIPSSIRPHTTLIPANEEGEPLTIRGLIYQADGKTPASGIILYVYQTDHTGLYSKGMKETEKTVHGRIRGWVQTGKDGKYSIQTIRPASYPNSRAPQHIHAIIKEDGLTPYWIDDYTFNDDPFINEAYRTAQQDRGGSGIISLHKNSSGVWEGERNIILGKNISAY